MAEAKSLTGIAFILATTLICLLLLSGCNKQSTPDTQPDTQLQTEQVQQEQVQQTTPPTDAANTAKPESSASDVEHAATETSSWIVPDGFEAVDMGTPPSGTRYVYRNSKLNMTITVWESAISYLPFSSTDEWLEADYNAYMNGEYGDTPTYNSRDNSKIVLSGYKTDGSVYYIMEAAASPRIYSVTFEYPAGSDKANCDKIVAQFMDNYSYQG